MKKYDIAISFVGEYRYFVDIIANDLKKDYHVFYDSFEQHELWGSDLSQVLPEKYVDAKYCLMFICEEYLTRMWTVLERQAIVSEFLKRNGHNYILPVRLNGYKGKVPGISDLIGFLEIDTKKDAQKLIDILKLRLR